MNNIGIIQNSYSMFNQYTVPGRQIIKDTSFNKMKLEDIYGFLQQTVVDNWISEKQISPKIKKVASAIPIDEFEKEKTYCCFSEHLC